GSFVAQKRVAHVRQHRELDGLESRIETAQVDAIEPREVAGPQRQALPLRVEKAHAEGGSGAGAGIAGGAVPRTDRYAGAAGGERSQIELRIGKLGANAAGNRLARLAGRQRSLELLRRDQRTKAHCGVTGSGLGGLVLICISTCRFDTQRGSTPLSSQISS